MSVRRPKVMTLVGTRPEVIKMSRVIAELERVSDHVLVHSGQNYDYELNQVFFDELGLPKPQHFLGAAGGTAAETIATVIARADEVMAQEAPDALVLYGDTNTCLAVIPAKRRHIPVFHLEAGNRCFDDRVPEEVNRRVVDHLSDINLPLTEHARRYLLAEGIRPETVFKVGSPIKEVYAFHREAIEASNVLDRLALEEGRFLLVSAHREENVDDPAMLRALLDCLLALASVHEVPVVVSTHPRTRERLDRLDHDALAAKDVRFMRPFGYLDYVHLQSRALCVVSDSGTLTEESALLGFPAVMIRQAHERPEGMDAGVLVATCLSPDRVVHAVETVVAQVAEAGRSAGVPDYEVDDVSRRVARIVLSYIDYVRRTVYFDSGDR